MAKPTTLLPKKERAGTSTNKAETEQMKILNKKISQQRPAGGRCGSAKCAFKLDIACGRSHRKITQSHNVHHSPAARQLQPFRLFQRYTLREQPQKLVAHGPQLALQIIDCFIQAGPRRSPVSVSVSGMQWTQRMRMPTQCFSDSRTAPDTTQVGVARTHGTCCLSGSSCVQRSDAEALREALG